MTKHRDIPQPACASRHLLGNRESLDLRAGAHDQARVGAGQPHCEFEPTEAPRSVLTCPNETGLPTMTTSVRCQHCEGAIRVSEPMIVLTDGQACRTSRNGVT